MFILDLLLCVFIRFLCAYDPFKSLGTLVADS